MNIRPKASYEEALKYVDRQLNRAIASSDAVAVLQLTTIHEVLKAVVKSYDMIRMVAPQL